MTSPTASHIPLPRTRTRDDVEWRARAACRGDDVNTYFPWHIRPPARPDDHALTTARQHAASALAACGRCPVTGPCLTEALRHGDPWAVAGGTTPTDRARLTSAGHVDLPHRAGCLGDTVRSEVSTVTLGGNHVIIRRCPSCGAAAIERRPAA